MVESLFPAAFELKQIMYCQNKYLFGAENLKVLWYTTSWKVAYWHIYIPLEN
jgi:hypothetical protein